MRTYSEANDWKWLRRGALAAVVAVGWAMIVVTNKLHVTAPVVFICLAYLAAVITVFMLFKMGATAAMPRVEDDSVLAWGAPIGPRGELEREKRMLLKAIKEAEFDRDMGKLSAADATQMIAVYRGRAIELIKQLDAGGAGVTARQQIEREVRARAALDEAAGAARKDKARRTKGAAASGGGKGRAARNGANGASGPASAAREDDKPAPGAPIGSEDLEPDGEAAREPEPARAPDEEHAS